MTRPKVNMTPPHPGEFMRIEVLEDLDLTVKEVAEILGVGEATISDLLNGNAALTPKIVQRIEKAFGVGRDMLLRIQKWHNESRKGERALGQIRLASGDRFLLNGVVCRKFENTRHDDQR